MTDFFEFIICTCITLLIFGWAYYRFKHGKHDISVDLGIILGWMAYIVTIIKLIKFIGTI